MINLRIPSIIDETLVMQCINSEDMLLGNNKSKQNNLNSFSLPSEYRVMLSTSSQHLTLRRRIFLPKNEKPSKQHAKRSQYGIHCNSGMYIIVYIYANSGILLTYRPQLAGLTYVCQSRCTVAIQPILGDFIEFLSQGRISFSSPKNNFLCN